MVGIFRITWLAVLALTFNVNYAQEPDFDIATYIELNAYSVEDTISLEDSINLVLELRNASKDTIHIYPNGIVYLRLKYTEYDYELYLVSDRKTETTEEKLLPDSTIIRKLSFNANKDIFHSGENIFRVIHITYPFWLRNKERSYKFYGRLESDWNSIVVL